MLGFSSIKDMLIAVPVTLIALTGHELSHAWVSSKLGDPTPENEGRLTLNPFAHLDPIGTLMMILTGFGWARPVGINPMYYKKRKLGIAVVSIAGPLANFIMAFIGMLILTLLGKLHLSFSGAAAEFFIYSLREFIILNISLMVFNLIPLPPLDGSKVVGMFLPDNIYYRVLEYERYCMIIIMLLSFSGALSRILSVGINIVLSFIGVISSLLLSWI